MQALYQMDIAGAGIEDIFAEFESHWLGSEVEGDTYLPAEAAFFKDVVSGVVRDQSKLDPLIDKALESAGPSSALTRSCARRCGREPTNSNTARTFRRASWCRNMSMSRMPSSTRTKPAW